MRDKKCRQVEAQCRVTLRNKVLPHRLRRQETATTFFCSLSHPRVGCSPPRHCALKTLLEASQGRRRRPHLLRPWRTVTVEPLTAEQPSRLHARPTMPCPACPALPCPALHSGSSSSSSSSNIFHWRAPASQGALAQTRLSYQETMTYDYCCHSQLINSESCSNSRLGHLSPFQDPGPPVG
jgi:hypothetical protein